LDARDNSGNFFNLYSATGNLEFYNNNGGIHGAMNASGRLALGLNYDTPIAQLDVRGDSGILAVASFSGQTSFANTVIDQSGSGDIFTASKSGATKFVIQNNGNIEVSNGTSLVAGVTNTGLSCASVVNGIVTGTGSCVGGNTTWNEAAGAIYAGNTTEDLLIGGTATSSAGFAVTGIAGTTPQATISAARGNKNGISLDASTSTIQSLNNNTLTIGGGTTGNIALSPIGGAGTVTVNGGLTQSGGAVSLTGNAASSLTTSAGALTLTSEASTTWGTGGSNQQLTLSASGNMILSVNSGGTGTLVDNAGTVSIATAGNRTRTINIGGTSGTSFVLPTTITIGSLGGIGSGGSSVLLQGATTSLNIANNLNLSTTNATLPIATISGSTNFAGLVVDQKGSGDLFTASKSGATKFVITNSGNVGIGTNSPTANLQINQISSAVSGFVFNSSINVLGDPYNFAVTDGPGGTTRIGYDNLLRQTSISGGNKGIWNSSALTVSSDDPNASVLRVGGQNSLETGNVFEAWQNATGTTGLVFAINPSGTVATASVSASTSFAGMVVDNTGVGDLFTASKSGATKFVITNAGNVGIGTTSFANAATMLQLLDSSAVDQAPIAVFGDAGDSSRYQFLADRGGGGVFYMTSGNGAIRDNGSFSIQNNTTTHLYVSSTGTVGIGTAQSNPLATLDVRDQSGTTPIASFSGTTAIAGMVVDNSGKGDIFTASSSGLSRFTVKQSGTVIIGNTTNGIQFDPTATATCSGGSLFAVFCGNARPTKQITLTAEYPGAVITASGSAHTTGFMTSDASPSASANQYNFENYYMWDSTDNTNLNDYTVAVEVTLPKDFSAWPSSGNAITIDFNTGLTTTAQNALDVYIYKKGVSNTGIPVYFSTNNVSTSVKTWKQITITKSQLEGTTTWNQPGDQAVIYLKMKARDNTANYVQVGDIDLNYLSGF